jgi:hypothetical protein
MTSWGAVEFESPHPAVRIQHDAVVGFSRIEEISSLTRPWGLRRVRALCPCRTQAGQRRGVALRRRLVLLALALAATSVAVTAVPSLAAQSDHIPKGLQVPEGHRLVLGALGKGVQIYDLQRRRCLGSAGAGRRHPEGRRHGGPALCRADLAVGQGRERGGRPTRARASGRGPRSVSRAGYPVAAAGDDRHRAWPVRAGRTRPPTTSGRPRPPMLEAGCVTQDESRSGSTAERSAADSRGQCEEGSGLGSRR